jgi:CHASE1-domain containing sensor protein
MPAAPDPASTPSQARASRTSLTGSLRRGLSAWRDAIKRRDLGITLVLVVLSAGGGVLYATRDRERFELDVDARARRLHAAIDAGLERPLGALAAVHGLFLSDPNVTREKFRSFVGPLLQRYLSIYALEWMPIVPAADREAYEAEARAAGLTDYHFWTLDPSGRRIPMWPRPEYGPIHFMEPPSLEALGFDIAADPLRWPTAERARDIGMIAASPRFHLIEDAGKEDVFSVVIYLPVFPTLEPPGSMAGRRAALRGFVLAVFRLKPLLEAAIGQVLSTEGLRFALSDRSGQAAASEELFESEKGAYEALGRLDASAHFFEMPLNNPNHSWWLRVAARPRGLTAGVRGFTVFVLGALLSALLLVAVTALRAVVQLRRRVERVGPYTLVGRLGRGAMGVVYEARHALLRRPTAIKLLAPGVAGERALARFEREVQLTAALTHPSTIAIYDYGRTEKGVFYYAMELLRGVNLQHLVGIDGPLPAGRVVHLLEQACGALAEAHAAGLIHRDVKPANLMACKAGGIFDFLKVLDFGLVKDLGAADAAPSAPSRHGLSRTPAPVAVSQDGSLLGTPLYLAPEGVISPDSVDARLDIYGLGAVAYFLLSGSPPFTGATAIEIYARQRRGAPPPPSGPNEPMPPELSALVLECLAFKPEARPASARELRARLIACAGVPPWTEAMAAAWWAERGPAVEAAAQAARDAAGEAGTITTGARRLAPVER